MEKFVVEKSQPITIPNPNPNLIPKPIPHAVPDNKQSHGGLRQTEDLLFINILLNLFKQLFERKSSCKMRFDDLQRKCVRGDSLIPATKRVIHLPFVLNNI